LRVVGVDASRGAWLAVAIDDGRFAGASLTQTIADVLAMHDDARAVAIDIPLGIIETYGREADTAARRFIQPRGSSVFPTPPRVVVEAPDYDVARSICDERGWPRPSRQSYGMRHRILEADRAARLDVRLFEVHPEVSFRELAGRPLEKKRTLLGQTQRLELLASAGIHLDSAVDDDLLDAAVAAWTAARFARGEALPLPAGHTARLGAIWR
jgi:predicted RNase H-like nuclease